MNILGIETSCDETAASVVKDGQNILSNVVVSSLRKHSKYGGIIPEIASRKQLECINLVVGKCLSDAKIKLKDVEAIAVTSSPGLIGSLLVGSSFSNALSYALNKPLIEVDHIKAHLYANFLKSGFKSDFIKPKLPAIGLIVSGGHTSLYFVSKTFEFKLLGKTLDDAAGEAFDKVARILDLGYPGGPVIDKIAKKSKSNNICFTSAKLTNSYNFSFSGVKTAVLYHKRKHQLDNDYCVSDIAYAFQNSVVSVLVDKSISACKKYNVKTLLIGGGVAANSTLRKSLKKVSSSDNIKVYFPKFSLCMDNAAMIAGLGYHIYKQKNHI